MPTDNPNPPNASDDNMFAVTVTKKDKELERLQSKLQEVEDSRKEERFGWIVAVLAIVNYLLLKDVPNLLTPLIVFIFELVALLVLARRSGLEYIELIFSKLIGSVTKRIEK